MSVEAEEECVSVEAVSTGNTSAAPIGPAEVLETASARAPIVCLFLLAAI